ncbi:MAG: hypothetical protein K2Y37_19825 [Pirellulales bacterium]|nr:hypothetical protein [Pirellulales bacterium]
MRGILLSAWLLVPAAVAAYHYGPGQQQMLVDGAAARLAAADRHVAAGELSKAIVAYDDALALLPAAWSDAGRRARLSRAQAKLEVGRLPEAYDELTELVAEVTPDASARADFKAEARDALASAQYYLTWLMRLEGEPREQWEPEIEAARQNYRLLAEQSTAAGDSEAAATHRQDLEAAIRLARMDLSELQALPLPKQCCGCCSGQCKCKGKGKTPKEKSGPQDARGASSGPPPDNRGS